MFVSPRHKIVLEAIDTVRKLLHRLLICFLDDKWLSLECCLGCCSLPAIFQLGYSTHPLDCNPKDVWNTLLERRP